MGHVWLCGYQDTFQVLISESRPAESDFRLDWQIRFTSAETEAMQTCTKHKFCCSVATAVQTAFCKNPFTGITSAPEPQICDQCPKWESIRSKLVAEAARLRASIDLINRSDNT